MASAPVVGKSKGAGKMREPGYDDSTNTLLPPPKVEPLLQLGVTEVTAGTQALLTSPSPACYLYRTRCMSNLLVDRRGCERVIGASLLDGPGGQIPDHFAVPADERGKGSSERST